MPIFTSEMQCLIAGIFYTGESEITTLCSWRRHTIKTHKSYPFL